MAHHRLRVGFVSHWFDPEGGAAAHPGVVARALRDQGHDVTVLTGFPTYPDGNVFPGYKLRPWRSEVQDGLKVLRGAIYPSHDSRSAHRGANYLSFALSGATLAVSALRDVDVLYVYSSPATTALPAMALKATTGIPYVLHIQDLWPETVLSSGLIGAESGRVERVLHRFCDAAYRHAHTVAVTSPGMAERITDRGVPASKVKWIPNWADEGSFYPTSTSAATHSALGPLRAYTAMYAGNFGELQSLETVIEAADHLRGRADIGFVLVGAGVAEGRLRAMVEARALDNVRFLPPQPFKQMADVLSAGDTQLVSLRDAPLFASTLPSKLQATLAAGRPVVGAVRGDAARVIRESGAGDAVSPGDASALARAVARQADLSISARQDLGTRGRRYYEENFSEAVLAKQLSHILTAASDERQTR
jgi:colanic acid biosynthesis glycosyl transferase WcaI